MKSEIMNGVPDEMLYGFAGATLFIIVTMALSITLIDQTLRTGTAIILGVGAVICGYLTYWAYKKRVAISKKNNSIKGK